MALSKLQLLTMNQSRFDIVLKDTHSNSQHLCDSYMSLEHQRESLFLANKHQHLIVPGNLCRSPTDINKLFLVTMCIISYLFLGGKQTN